MRVSVKLSKEYTTPYAVIYTDAVTDEIQNAIDYSKIEKAGCFFWRTPGYVKPADIQLENQPV